jgi:hypothetical protein
MRERDYPTRKQGRGDETESQQARMGKFRRDCARTMAIMTTPRSMSRFHPSCYFESLNIAIHQRYSAWTQTSYFLLTMMADGI